MIEDRAMTWSRSSLRVWNSINIFTTSELTEF